MKQDITEVREERDRSKITPLNNNGLTMVKEAALPEGVLSETRVRAVQIVLRVK
jgi:hypothetical protein